MSQATFKYEPIQKLIIRNRKHILEQYHYQIGEIRGRYYFRRSYEMYVDSVTSVLPRLEIKEEDLFHWGQWQALKDTIRIINQLGVLDYGRDRKRQISRDSDRDSDNEADDISFHPIVKSIIESQYASDYL